MSLSVLEVENLLKKALLSDADLDIEEDWESDLWREADYALPAEILGLGYVELVEDFGGEGEGNHCHIIFKVTSVMDEAGSYVQNVYRYFKIDGFYTSYDGSNYEDESLYEVEPYEKTETAYRKVK